MEGNPGDDWAPQQPRCRRARRANYEITSWEHCFNHNCNEHRLEKVDAGYYPRLGGEKGELTKNDRREHKKRRAVRTRLGGEGGEKPFRRWKPWKDKSRTSEANSMALPKSLWQKITTSNGSIRKRKKCIKPIIDANSGWAKWGEYSGRKEFGIVGPMREGEWS